MNTPPEVKILCNEATRGYAITGFEEFDRWAQCNDTLWRIMTRHGQIVGVNEYDRVRLLAAALLRHKVEIEAKRFEYMRQHGTAPY